MEKVIIVGDRNTGKSALVHRVMLDSFKESYEKSVGANVYEYKHMQLWDISEGGLMDGYMIGATKAICMCDLTNLESYYTILKEYLPSIRRVCGYIPIIIACNKYDLTGQPLKRFITKPGVSILNISVKSGFNVDSLLS
jgi:small GTP-binding protein